MTSITEEWGKRRMADRSWRPGLERVGGSGASCGKGARIHTGDSLPQGRRPRGCCLCLGGGLTARHLPGSRMTHTLVTPFPKDDHAR
jgi:hypothetical protein